MMINDVMFSADLETILNELVAELRLNGIPYIQKMIPTVNDIQICCPYHNSGMERKPSAGIRRSDGLFHCFACGEVHSLPEVVSHCFGKDNMGVFGWSWLLKNFATIGVENRKDINLNLSRNPKKEKTEYITEEELDKYRYIHPYMYKRRLTDEIIEMFDIGYDKDTDCITFPNRDINGNCVFVARRSVRTKFFSYPEGVEKPVYGLYELSRCNYISGKRTGPSIIICESMLDALTCWVYGKPAVALNGTGTDAQIRDLKSFPCRKYIIATDMDSAGLKARIRLKKSLANKIVTEYIWDVKQAKDINDMEKPYFDGLEEVF